jgi:putative nucleotidyltransferase with HDIG domain
VPERLDKHKERFHWRERLAEFAESVEKMDPRRFESLMMIVLVVGLTVLMCTAYLPTLHSFAEGDVASRTITAGKTVTVVDSRATEELKVHLVEVVAPFYVPDATALPAATAELDGFFNKVDQLRQADATVDQARAELAGTIPSAISTTTLDYLLTVDSTSFAVVKDQALVALARLYGAGIQESSPQGIRLALQSICEQLAQESPQLVTVQKGTIVLEKGTVVTAQDILTLRALGLTGSRGGWKVWLGIFLIALLEAVVFSRLLYRFHKGTKEVTNNMLLALVLLLLGGTVIARLLIIPPLSGYLIPVAALGMVVSVILNARSALLCVTLASVNVGLLTDFNMRYTLAALLVGALSLYLVSKVTKRAALLATALVSMFLSALTIFALELFSEASVGDALRRCLWGFGNGFLVGVLTILLLLFLESVLNITTPLRLLELADPAHPLLKKLLQLAPGTYNHSIMMGTLAEGAAEVIGANPNLARVGAYYHDIGKVARPEYFIENQIYVGNPHDHLSPHLSKVAIAAHVRDGERLGRMHGLPKSVVDIVKQHHGTSLLTYFYNKALESSKQPIPEESYRYEGEKPQSKEAAIIMLADGVEAAVRALERPTRRKIQGVIQEIIKQRVEDGQLDESALTQGDLHRISDAFDLSLVGLLGHRIQYPGYAQEAVHQPAGHGERGRRHGGKSSHGSEGGK